MQTLGRLWRQGRRQGRGSSTEAGGYAVATVGKIRIAADELHIKIRPEDDATYIAACSPEVIHALLAERDTLKSALTGAANYIDTLGGNSKKYRAALAQEQGGSNAE